MLLSRNAFKIVAYAFGAFRYFNYLSPIPIMGHIYVQFFFVFLVVISHYLCAYTHTRTRYNDIDSYIAWYFRTGVFTFLLCIVFSTDFSIANKIVWTDKTSPARAHESKALQPFLFKLAIFLDQIVACTYCILIVNDNTNFIVFYSPFNDSNIRNLYLHFY